MILPARGEVPAHAHLAGIGGTGMSALAGYLLERGSGVTGSDMRRSAVVRDLELRRVHVACGHAARNLPSRADLVVRSLAVAPDAPELEAAVRRGIPVLSYPQALGALAREHFTLGVAGTHGKTTTSAMLAHVLLELDADPSWILGGAPAQGMSSYRAGAGDTLVLESCEYARSMMQIPADIAVVTSIDDDHLDCYGDLAGVRATFLEYASGVAAGGGQLVLAADLQLGGELPRGVDPSRVATFGLTPEADWGATGIESCPDGTRFVLCRRGQGIAQVSLPMVGAHSVHNALAAIVAATLRGHDPREVAASLSSFPGIGRRLQCLGSHGDVVYYDDYAHHPTAVNAVLRALRDGFPERRLVAVFEPHQVTRTLHHLSAFATALEQADVCAVTEIHTARDPDPGAISGSALVHRLQSRGCAASFTPTLDEVGAFLGRETRAGDVVVMMGAGRVGETFAQRMAETWSSVPEGAVAGIRDGSRATRGAK